MSKVSEEQPGERTRQRSRRWGMYREIDALIDDNRELATMTPAEIQRYSGGR